jgi:hypothetical protein
MTMKPHERSSESRGGSQTLALVGVCLALASAMTIWGLVNAVHHESGDPILWFGLLSVTLIFGSSLCLFAALAAFIKQRRTTERTARAVATDADYVAEYPGSDRVTALLIAVFFGVLTAFLVLRSATPGMIALSGLFFGGGLLYAVHIMTTCVRFTRSGFVARLPWFRTLQEPYERVQRISGKPGTLRVQFSDGRVLRLHSGLGDPDAVIAHLQARCPESLHLD